MAYQAGKPLANDKLNVSQGDLLNNFTALGTWAAVDHHGLNAAGAYAGKHKVVRFHEQAYVTPNFGPATLADEIAVFCNDSLVNPGEPALFLQWANQAATVKPIEFTASSKDLIPNNSEGYTVLPSGIIIKWGKGSAPHGYGAAIVFPGTSVPFTQTPIVTISTTYVNGEHGTFLSTVGKTSFTTYNVANNTQTVNYIAIGF